MKGSFVSCPQQTIVEIRHMMYNVRVRGEKATEVVAR
jgi:hypothetical protein